MDGGHGLDGDGVRGRSRVGYDVGILFGRSE
jgi:hypothetical protein